MRLIDFWSYVDSSAGPDSCWPWIGSFGPRGCGHFYCDGGQWRAPRLACKLTHNKNPGRWKIRHTCDNPPCCNPRHLRRGTQRQNVLDAVTRGRWNRPSGIRHPLAKLTAAKIKWAGKEHCRGQAQNKLARVLKVSPQALSRALRGETWRNVNGQDQNA